jgi:hypothetical protein
VNTSACAHARNQHSIDEAISASPSHANMQAPVPFTGIQVPVPLFQAHISRRGRVTRNKQRISRTQSIRQASRAHIHHLSSRKCATFQYSHASIFVNVKSRGAGGKESGNPSRTSGCCRHSIGRIGRNTTCNIATHSCATLSNICGSRFPRHTQPGSPEWTSVQ